MLETQYRYNFCVEVYRPSETRRRENGQLVPDILLQNNGTETSGTAAAPFTRKTDTTHLRVFRTRKYYIAFVERKFCDRYKKNVTYAMDSAITLTLFPTSGLKTKALGKEFVYILIISTN
jgi:hypothetical protein